MYVSGSDQLSIVLDTVNVKKNDRCVFYTKRNIIGHVI